MRQNFFFYLKTNDDYLDYCIKCVFTICIVHSFFVLIWKINAPLTDVHGFRQTQTAITAFWLPEKWSIFAYQTPVLGYPWSIPFEFPLYQVIATIISFLGIPLDAAGRILSWLSMVGSLYPMRKILNFQVNDDQCFWFFAPLYLASPMYIFWGRTFMIETFAVFLFCMFVLYSIKYFCYGRHFDIIMVFLFSALGLLTKITTSPPFYLAVLLILLEQRRRSGHFPTRNILLLFFMALALSGAIALYWVHYSDELKSQNLFAQALTSTSLSSWNFGPLFSRFDLSKWADIVLRANNDILGSYLFPIMPLLAIPFVPKKYAHFSLVLIFLYILPIFIFFNLHYVHNYYDVANALFLIAAVGVSCAGLNAMGRSITSFLLLVTALVAMTVGFYKGYLGDRLLASSKTAVDIGYYVKTHTEMDSGMIVLGCDWSSEIGYYAQRKGISVPTWAFDKWPTVLEHIDTYLGGLPLEALVICPSTIDTDQIDAATKNIANIIPNKFSTPIGGCIVVTGGDSRGVAAQ